MRRISVAFYIPVIKKKKKVNVPAVRNSPLEAQ